MIKPEITIHLRRFRVALRNKATGETAEELLVLDKTQLQAAQIVGQSSKALIERFAARNGYELLDVIGKPDKLSITIPLDELWQWGTGEVVGI